MSEELFSDSTRSITLTDLNCTGFEEEITECLYSTDSLLCGDLIDAGVVCQGSATLLKMDRYYNTTMRYYWDMLVK